jgi:epoxyqueuosine reductase QueG
MSDSKQVKALVRSLGADLCGIAGIDRFADAPKGYHPLDVFPLCRSVISFACRFPVGTLFSPSHAPYTKIRNAITAKMERITLEVCTEMERHGVLCVPIPVNGCEWDPATDRWRSVVSLKHAAQAAGLGTIGRHSLLITPEFGSMVWLGAVLCAEELEADDLKEPVCAHCELCVEACPVRALDGPELNQQLCREHAFGEDETTRVWRIACHRCRDACPHNLGYEHDFL